MLSISSAPARLADRIHNYSLRFDWLSDTSRLRAFTNHLFVSLTVVSIVFAVVFFVWYPTPFFAAVGAWSIIRVLVAVDLVAGPLLTLIVFKPGKRLLIVDVVFIAILQFSALLYGLTVLYQERPYFAVFAIDRFHVLSELDVSAEQREPFEWIEKPVIGPLLASARLPKSIEEQQRLIDETVFGGAPDIEQRPSLWAPYAEDAGVAANAAYPLTLLRDAGHSELIERTIARLGIAEADLGFFPMISSKNDACAIVDRTNGKLVSVLDIEPWEILN
jgi:hypothetical protein